METQDDQAAYDAEFQAALAHDLRNGLPAIIGSQRQIQYATVLRMRALPLVEEAIRLLSEFKSELAVLAVDAAKLLLYRCTNCEFWIEMKECTTAFR